MDENYKALIASDRVSPQTRAVLDDRGSPDDAKYRSVILTDDQLATLRALSRRIIPQGVPRDDEIDLAARLDQQLSAGKGDGWRYASLPADHDAYAAGLTLLDELAQELSENAFTKIPPSAQDALLTAIAAGRVKSETFDLKRWFEDARAALTGIYVSHPDTLARMHYSGIADDPDGFMQIGIGQVETWEPR